MDIDLDRLDAVIRRVLDEFDRGEFAPLSGHRRRAARDRLQRAGAEIAAILSASIGVISDVRRVEKAGFDVGRECLSAERAHRQIGRGHFGQVYDIGGGKVVKSVYLATPYYPFEQGLKLLRKEAANGRLMGELGVGPAVHGATVCRSNDTWVGLITMDNVAPSMTLQRWRAEASKKGVEAAEAMLRAKLKKMHDASLFHQDLHSGNVLVAYAGSVKKTAKDVFIIDYGFSRTAKDLRDEDASDVQDLGDGRLPVAGAEANKPPIDEIALVVVDRLPPTAPSTHARS